VDTMRPNTIAHSTYSMLGQRQVVRTPVRVDRLLGDLPRVADREQHEHAGHERRHAPYGRRRRPAIGGHADARRAHQGIPPMRPS